MNTLPPQSAFGNSPITILHTFGCTAHVVDNLAEAKWLLQVAPGVGIKSPRGVAPARAVVARVLRQSDQNDGITGYEDELNVTRSSLQRAVVLPTDL